MKSLLSFRKETLHNLSADAARGDAGAHGQAHAKLGANATEMPFISLSTILTSPPR